MSNDKLAQALREALAWGMVYGPAIPAHQWDEMREEKITLLLQSIAEHEAGQQAGPAGWEIERAGRSITVQPPQPGEPGRLVDPDSREAGDRILYTLCNALLSHHQFKKTEPGFDECVASGQSCSYGPHGRKGEMQCRYCGKEQGPAPAPTTVAPTTEDDPCPGCRPGGVCRTPSCGRLKLPLTHHLRMPNANPPAPASRPPVPKVQSPAVQHGKEQVPFADGENPCVLEWGAVSLPLGDPSRITEMKLCPTLWDAIAEGALCGFDWRVYPLALKPRPESEPPVQESQS